MRTAENKLQSLKRDSVWLFTKQDTNFEQAYYSSLLFSEIPDKENTNIERYFTDHHERYDINTDRHRVLVISQFYGLITKTPFYSRGGTYNNENCTAVFDAFKGKAVGSKEYNKLKTEQILKLKIHAIIDTANNNEGYNILPIVFIYKVLRSHCRIYLSDSADNKRNILVIEFTCVQLFTHNFDTFLIGHKFKKFSRFFLHSNNC